jgi:hypothetical protein
MKPPLHTPKHVLLRIIERWMDSAADAAVTQHTDEAAVEHIRVCAVEA